MNQFVRKKRPDYFFAITIIVLIVFGIIMISSSSIVVSMENTGKNYAYVLKQVTSLFFGILAMLATYAIDYRFWKKNSFWMLIITILLLLMVFVPGIGKSAGGAHRWIGIGGQWFQPSELIKLTFLIYLAAWLENRAEKIENFWTGFVPFLSLILLVGGLIMFQPDLGTTSVLVLSAVTVFFVAGANPSHMVFGAGFFLILLTFLIKTSHYRQQRLMVFLNPSIDSQGAAYHINQALLAIGAGGAWGLGFGQSKQKYLYLPEAHTDSIFAIIAEELGFVRSGLLIAGYLLIAYLGLKIARKAPDRFAKFLTVGIISWIVYQAFINIGAMLGLLPLTGVPLPFVSYGGSSLIILLAAIGIILNISKHTTGEAS